MKFVRFGVMGAAKIARQKVIPAIQAGKLTRVDALASRTLDSARAAAEALNIDKAYGSYEALLADPEIDAVYIPLPNHLHVEWAKAALDAGKHVLCEKPIGLDADQAKDLAEHAAKRPDLVCMEGFMYRFHPQWIRAKQIVDNGEIGRLVAVQTFFAYHNADPGNIRNIPEAGGGALMDIGCYPISLSRWLFGAQPVRVSARMELDPDFGTDRTVAALIQFDAGLSDFVCSTQAADCQRVNIIGESGRVELEIPFNAPPSAPCVMHLQTGKETTRIETEPCDQYSAQADAFARAVLDGTPAPAPLSDAVENMAVIGAIFQSARTGEWVELD